MSEQPKKIRTEKQAAQNALLKDAVAWLGSKGLPKQVQYISIVKKGKAAGMSSPEIEAEVRKRVNENAGKKAEKKTAAAAPKAAAVAAPKAANNGTRNNKPKAGNANTKKVRSAAQLAANAKMKEMKAKFNAANIKYGSNSMKHYTAQRKAGREEEEILVEMKGLFPKYVVNESGAKKAVVVKRAVTMKKANGAKAANVVAPAVVGNAGVAKGQWVCDRCRLVANNTRRNNKPKNNKPKNYSTNNFFPVNMTNFEG